MDHIVTIPQTPPPPTYADRRAEMADQTRVRILDACVRILARGVAELSIPAVAREAGVSVPTVYRHFADKKTLFHETAVHLRQLRGPYRAASSLDQLPATIREQFALAGSMSEVVRAALVSAPIMSVRRESGEGTRRVGAIEALLGDELKELAPAERHHAATIIAVLCSSMTLRTFMEVSGMTPEQAADTVIWTIGRVLGRELEPRTRGKGKAKR
jgi:AcrR family transcriptional regulator